MKNGILQALTVAILLAFAAVIALNGGIAGSQAKSSEAVQIMQSNGETEAIKSVITSYWEYSRSMDPKRLEFVTEFPQSFNKACFTTAEITKPEKSPMKNGVDDDGIPTLDMIVTTAPGYLETLSRQIGENDWQLEDFYDHRISGTEALVYVSFSGKPKVRSNEELGITVTFSNNGKDMAFALTKEGNNSWRIFEYLPESVVLATPQYARFGAKSECVDQRR